MTSAGCGAGRALSLSVRLFVEEDLIPRPKRAEGRRVVGPTLAHVRRTPCPPAGSGAAFDLAIGFAFHKSAVI